MCVLVENVAHSAGAVVATQVVVAVMVTRDFFQRRLALIHILHCIEGLKACEWFLIGVVRVEGDLQVRAQGVEGVVARCLLSIRTLLPTQCSQHLGP